MKKLIIPALFCFIVQISFAQNATNMSKPKMSPNGTIHYLIMDEVPQFDGCSTAENILQCTDEKIRQFLISSLRNDVAAKSAVKGEKEQSIYIRFTVDKKGNVGNIGVRSQDSNLRAKVAQILKKLPKFTPGKHNAKVVNTSFDMHVYISDALVNKATKNKL